MSSAHKKRKLNGSASLSGAAPPKAKPTTTAKAPAKTATTQRAPSDQEDEYDTAPSTDAAAAAGAPEEAATLQADTTAHSADESKKTFADLGVRDELCDACANLNFTTPTPIQTQAIPLALQGRDVIGLAETGSGKTAAFVLPILQSLLEKPQALFGLILAPTRELAYQIAQQVDALGSIINVKCATLVGGMDMVPQAIALSKRPHIVVATPGTASDASLCKSIALY